MTPRISCLLATGDRRDFARQALRCFLRQTRFDAELIVIDSGREPVEDLCEGIVSVRYIRVPEGTKLGTKLNIGAENARGAILQKIDDDDYYHPDFLARGVGALERDGRENAIAAWDCFHVHFPGDDELRYSKHDWAAGGTLSFRREVWKRTPFRDIPSAVDHWFLLDANAPRVRVCAPELYVLLRHGANTWRHLSEGTDVDRYFRAMPRAGRKMSAEVEPLDVAFYDGLARRLTAAR